ncbi:MAG: hypothetical protein R3F43_33135 [bacterium]
MTGSVRRITLEVHPDEASGEALRLAAARAALGVDESRVQEVRPLRRGVDARRGRVRVAFQLAVAVDGPLPPPP